MVDDGINCKVRGLPMVHHNNPTGTFNALAAMSMTKSCVLYKLKLFYCTDVFTGQGITDLENTVHE